MIKVILAGNYPKQTYEKLRKLLPEQKFELEEVNEQSQFDAVTDAEIIILRIFKAPKEVFERNPKLKIILRWGAGFDSVDIEEAGKRGIPVTNTPGANANAVSELTVMLMLALGRKLQCHMESLKNGIWSKNTFLNQSYCLNQKRVGIIGGGNIGRQVAAKVQAFGASVQYYDAVRLPQEMEEQWKMTYLPLDELLQTSDIVTLHVPLVDETRHMIGEEQIKKMKEGAILINTARGGLVDDVALEKAVRTGMLSGAGLDVVEREPLSAQDELLHNPNIIVTPHIGGGTADLGDIIIPMLVNDILRLSEGEEPEHIVNKKYFR